MDYIEAFSLVVKMTTIRSLIATVVKKHWPIYHLDVNNAILHRDLDKEIYMKPLQELTVASPNVVYKFKKFLYGLKQPSK